MHDLVLVTYLVKQLDVHHPRITGLISQLTP